VVVLIFARCAEKYFETAVMLTEFEKKTVIEYRQKYVLNSIAETPATDFSNALLTTFCARSLRWG